MRETPYIKKERKKKRNKAIAGCLRETPSIRPPSSFSPSLIRLKVSVDVKYHFCLLSMRVERSSLTIQLKLLVQQSLQTSAQNHRVPLSGFQNFGAAEQNACGEQDRNHSRQSVLRCEAFTSRNLRPGCLCIATWG